MTTTALKAEPIPVNIKIIIMIGEPYIYYLLYNPTRSTGKLFKVKADFDSIIEKTNENMDKYAPGSYRRGARSGGAFAI